MGASDSRAMDEDTSMDADICTSVDSIRRAGPGCRGCPTTPCERRHVLGRMRDSRTAHSETFVAFVVDWMARHGVLGHPHTTFFGDLLGSVVRPAPWPPGLLQLGAIEAMYPLGRGTDAAEWNRFVIDAMGRLLLSLQSWNAEQGLIERDWNELVEQLARCTVETATANQTERHRMNELLRVCQDHHASLQQGLEDCVKRLHRAPSAETDELRRLLQQTIHENQRTRQQHDELAGQLREQHRRELAACQDRHREHVERWQRCEAEREALAARPRGPPTLLGIGTDLRRWLGQRTSSIIQGIERGAFWWYTDFNQRGPVYDYTRTRGRPRIVDRRTPRHPSNGIPRIGRSVAHRPNTDFRDPRTNRTDGTRLPRARHGPHTGCLRGAPREDHRPDGTDHPSAAPVLRRRTNRGSRRRRSAPVRIHGSTTHASDNSRVLWTSTANPPTSSEGWKPENSGWPGSGATWGRRIWRMRC